MGCACIFTAASACWKQQEVEGASKLGPSKPGGSNKGELVTLTRECPLWATRTQKCSLPQESPALPIIPQGLPNKPFTVCSSVLSLVKQLHPGWFLCHSNIQRSLERGKERTAQKIDNNGSHCLGPFLKIQCPYQPSVYPLGFVQDVDYSVKRLFFFLCFQ